jgi:hypothetical protein
MVGIITCSRGCRRRNSKLEPISNFDGGAEKWNDYVFFRHISELDLEVTELLMTIFL